MYRYRVRTTANPAINNRYTATSTKVTSNSILAQEDQTQLLSSY